MRWERASNAVGLLLLAGCFAASFVQVLSRETRTLTGGEITLRFAHLQLEGGAREAFGAVALEYERQHPGVRVVQLAIPEKVFPTWVTTQLAGGTAPDMIEIGDNSSGVNSSDDERLVRYYEPLTAYLEQPNPYNAGTELAGVPWRETFLDGLQAAYNPRLLDFYGVPTTVTTVRVFYNRALWQQLLGDRPEPRTYAEFADICRTVRADGERLAGRPIIPIAGSGFTAGWITRELFASQTQRLWQERMHRLETVGDQIGDGVQRAFLRGDLTLDDPAIVHGCELVGEVSGFMQPGFLQLLREDALFLFVQGQALMITTGSWDATSIRQQIPFGFGAFPVPLPGTDNPRYGPFVLGPVSEAGRATAVSLALLAGSPHREQALDFLRFLTSQAGNREFARHSGWLPAVVGVEPAPEVQSFAPVFDGYLNGFTLAESAETNRVIATANYLLMGPNGSAARFLDRLRDEYPPAIDAELRRRTREAVENVTLQDSTLAAYRRLADPRLAPDEASARTAARKVSELNEGQNQREVGLYGLLLDLHRAGR